MRYYLFSILLFFLSSCEKEEPITPATFDLIGGKWNLETYEDKDGKISDYTYTIFTWYETGLEFMEDGFVFPRYGPPEYSKWHTNYENEPGTYQLIDETLYLSLDTVTFSYDFRVIDDQRIELSNYNPDANPWIGKWVLIKN